MTVFQTQTEYAEHRGITQSRVSRLVSKGKIPKSCIKKISGRKLIDRDKADAALSENLDQIYNRPNKKPVKLSKTKTPSEQKKELTDAGRGLVSLNEAQTIKANYDAWLKELEYQIKKGEYVDAEKVKQDAFNIARRVRDSLLNIPDRISADLASDTDTHSVSEKLTREIIQALEELAA